MQKCPLFFHEQSFTCIHFRARQERQCHHNDTDCNGQNQHVHIGIVVYDTKTQTDAPKCQNVHETVFKIELDSIHNFN